jgi:hypothetical protein
MIEVEAKLRVITSYQYYEQYIVLLVKELVPYLIREGAEADLGGVITATKQNLF